MARLGDICCIVSGTTPKSSCPEYWDGDINWITPAELTENSDVIYESQRKITKQAVEDSSLKPFPAGTVLLSSRAPIGKVAIAGVEMYCNQGFKNLICSESIYNRYLFHFLKSKTDYLNSLGRGATFKEISKSIVENIDVPLPSLEEQRKIAAQLDKVSDLIAKREAQLDKLDLLVKARFVEMFGDPVGNPMKWEETTIGRECYYIKDGPHKSLKDVGKGNGYPFISVRNIVNGSIDFSTAKYISEQDYFESIKKCSPQKGDMLYSKGGTTGIAKLIDVDTKFANWVHVAVLKFDDSLDGIFFENMLNSEYCYTQSQRLTKGIANRDLVLSAMAKIQLYKPPVDLQKKFACFVRKIEKIKLNVRQSLEELEILKKALIQEYFG